MTDAEIIKAEDFLGNEINIGDEVIFEAPKYRDFVVGKVITKAEKTCQIEYVNDWNYPTKGRTEVVRQYYCQIIKHPAILINRQNEYIKKCDNLARIADKTIASQKAEIERLEKVQVQYIKAYFDEFAERLKNDFRLAQLDIGLTNAVVDELVETMNNELNTLADFTDLIRAEVIKEFAERLKRAKQYSLERHENIVPVAVVDWIVKEMAGDAE